MVVSDRLGAHLAPLAPHPSRTLADDPAEAGQCRPRLGAKGSHAATVVGRATVGTP
jgi:hypothetical protein